MAYQFSKGWYLQELKKAGINYHPLEKRKLENYKRRKLEHASPLQNTAHPRHT